MTFRSSPQSQNAEADVPSAVLAEEQQLRWRREVMLTRQCSDWEAAAFPSRPPVTEVSRAVQAVAGSRPCQD